MVILAGSPRGGEKTWKSLFKYVVDHLNADLAICTTDNFVSKNILFEKANYKWIMENPVNFENYYSKNYTGNWKEYLSKGKGLGLYESGMIHFALKDYIKREHIKTLNNYEYIIYSRFDQYYIDYHPDVNQDKLYIPNGEDYFGICDRHAVLKSKKAEKFLSIIEYIDKKTTINDLPKYPNCESVYKKHLVHIDFLKDVERYQRISFTAAIKNEPTNWRVPTYKIFLSNKLMIKYPDEFLTAFEEKYLKKSFLKYLLEDYPLNLYFIYIKLRRRLGEIFKKKPHLVCEEHGDFFLSDRYKNLEKGCPECGT